MIGIFDQEMFNPGWDDLAIRLTALALHIERLRAYPVNLLWRDEFEATLYQNESIRRDIITLVSGVLEYLRGNGRIRSNTPSSSSNTPSVFPLIGASLPTDARELWLRLVGGAVANTETLMQGIGIFTWQRQDLHRFRTIRVSDTSAVSADIPILRQREEWDLFLQEHHKPDLSRARVAVLGGKRAPFERARQELAAYGLVDLRWLPPSREEHRSQADTLSRLQSIDLIVVCTDSLGHSDTDHIKGVSLPCERRDIHNHSTTSIVQIVLTHFRATN